MLPYRCSVPNERILIVEDDERIGSTLLRALVGNAYDVAWEKTGLGAISDATTSRPDLVLLDLGLPDIDGLDVCRRLHEVDATIDIIMLTARDEELDIVVGLDAGAVDYITKPFKLAELTARIRAQLRELNHGRARRRPPAIWSSTTLRAASGSRATRSHSAPRSSICSPASSPTPGTLSPAKL